MCPTKQEVAEAISSLKSFKAAGPDGIVAEVLKAGGEPVVDYSLKFKKAFGPQTWVAGYCNDVMTYIPSLRVLKEGGYEGGKAMIPYGMPALRWADDVEDRITASAERLVQKARGGVVEK